MNVLIDTNIVLDALMHREPFCGMAEAVILMAAKEEMIGCITARNAKHFAGSPVPAIPPNEFIRI